MKVKSNHCDNRAGAEKVAEAVEERPLLQIVIVLLGERLCWNNNFDANEFESFPLESCDDFGDLRSKNI